MRDLLQYHFAQLTEEQINKMLILHKLYSEWNDKINVISRKDISNFNIHHLLHSLSIARLISFKKGSKILDIGTGGGFPGIPLAIMFPDVNFTLIDSIRKKTIVVEEVSKSLDINNVDVIWTRAEDLDDRFDFIVSRAVTAFPKFVSWTNGMIRKLNQNSLKNGILYLKGGDLDEELQDYVKKVTIYPLNNYFSESFFDKKKIVYLPLNN
ncbi:MAG: 16S rRNA (guanine(527)-N(7))-methyltransferase RsmG [Bacteroidales bacterium]|nr:16S rRNA (guanine(527)-N(7))-methyltransferase RsmG [Bacteroidales bacterium]